MQKPTEAELKIIDEICDVLHKHKVKADRGNELLAYITGVSCGIVAGSLTQNILPAMAIGFKHGCEGYSYL